MELITIFFLLATLLPYRTQATAPRTNNNAGASQEKTPPHRPIIVGTSEQRRTCPYYDTFGCIGDVLEKLCGGNGESGLGALRRDDPESVWVCCCKEPYIPCTNDEMDNTCLTSMLNHLPDEEENMNQQLALERVQNVRRDLIHSNTLCQTYFAPPEPYSKCNKHGGGSDPNRPLLRVVERADINCELLTWQYEVLGDGDVKEFAYNGCPIPEQKATQIEGALRKAPDPDEEYEQHHDDGGDGVYEDEM
jgi:hypothetical protein